MKLLTLRKSQFRKLGKEGSYVKMVALFLEMRMNPLDEFEKAFAEAYLMKEATIHGRIVGSSNENQNIVGEEEEPDPFA
jgi:hypothetical protein